MKARLSFVLTAVALFGQYKAEPAGTPPSQAAAMASTLSKDGAKILGANGSVYCEIWLRSTLPSGPASSEPNVTLPNIPPGALLGVIQFPGRGADRRGQLIKPGLYTLRYSNFPVNGDHQGVAPQRDFLVLSRIADDNSPEPVSTFDALMDLSRKASGTPHPLVLSFWKADSDFKPGFAKMGENDWILQTKIGDTPVAIILIGKVEG